MPMIGTFLNVAGIVLGAVLGLVKKKPFSAPNQLFFKVALGAFTVFFGLQLAWRSLKGSALDMFKQLGIVILALILGRLMGRWLHLQKTSNRLGQFARDRMASAQPEDPQRFTNGFLVCAALFCAAPIGILGAIHDGLSGYYEPLAVKMVMEGLAAMSFVSMFGWGVMFSAVPVLVCQGTISLVCARFLRPWLEAHGLVNSVNLTGGLLIFCVALIILEIKKIEVTDYLPSLVFAPLLTWWWLR